MEFPRKFPRKKTMTSKEVFELIEIANAHFREEKIVRGMASTAAITFQFLKDNTSTVTPSGELETGKKRGPWWDRNVDLTKDDFATLDLRATKMRQLALTWGMAHYLGQLQAAVLVPRSNSDYNCVDDVTNLACIRIHERLMGYKLEGGVHPYPHQDRLKQAFLLEVGNRPNALYWRYITMALLGLWTITRDGLRGRINLEVGPAAEIFHLKAYAPAVQYLKDDIVLKGLSKF